MRPAFSPPRDREEMTHELTKLRSQTVWRTLLAAKTRVPDRNALVGANDAGEIRRLTYETLIRRVRDVSAGLASIGVRHGDRVVLWMTNTPEWVVASFAIMRIGAIVVPINTFLKAAEIKYLIAQSEARHVVMLDAFRSLSMPEMLGEICPEFAATTRPGCLFSSELPELRNVIILHRCGGARRGAFDFTALEALGSADQNARELAQHMESESKPGDLGMIKYTSGSTSFPKGVMLEQGGIVANAILHSRRTGISETDVFFSMMPFFHGGGSIWGLMTMMVNGGTLVFTEAFNATLAVDLLCREKATVMFGVLGNEVIEVAHRKGVTLPMLRIAHVPTEDARRVMPNATFSIVPFGLTETYGPAGVSSPTDPPEKRGSSGRMLDGNECRVVDPMTGEDVSPGVAGEAWIRGNVMRGYWKKPDETKRAFTTDGWFRSEDIISMDADGYISYVGRLKLMLKVGGENVSIEEVERVVAAHDAVAECGAVGVPDARKGEAVRTYVAVRAGRKLDAAELHAWLQPRLAKFKMPREIVFLDKLPRLANGKLDRLTLNERAKTEVPL